MIWKDVPGWEKFYQVSKCGLVRSKDRTIIAKNPQGKMATRNYKGRILKPGIGSHGYLVVVFIRGESRQSFTVHALIMLTFKGPKPKNKEVLHGNGIKTDNRFSNLRYGTTKENAIEKFAHGYRHPTGFKSSRSKLNEKQVNWIRRNEGKLSTYKMGLRFSVHHSTIASVLKRKTYDN